MMDMSLVAYLSLLGAICVLAAGLCALGLYLVLRK